MNNDKIPIGLEALGSHEKHVGGFTRSIPQ